MLFGCLGYYPTGQNATSQIKVNRKFKLSINFFNRIVGDRDRTGIRQIL